jgi:hypothetical protein
MVTCLPKVSDYATNQTITPEAFGSAYQYDQLNRLSSSRVFTNINTTTNQWQSGAGTNPSAYATDYTYDAMVEQSDKHNPLCWTEIDPLGKG